MTTLPNNWPATMPGVDTDPSGGRRQGAALLDAVAKETMPVAAAFTAAELPPELHRVGKTAVDAIGDVRAHVHGAAAQLDALATNDLLPDRARARLTGEARETARKALDEAANRSNTAILTLEAGLLAQAQPEFPAGADRAEAREELKLLLDASPDPAGMIRHLAAGHDQRLAALAVGSFGASYLRSRGVPEPVITANQVFAAQASMRSSDPRRRAAARALARVNDLRKLRAKALAAANFAIGWE